MTSGSSMQAMIRIAPLQAGQVSMSIPNTRFRRYTQLIEARRSAAVCSYGSAVVACRPPLPRLAGVTRVRYWLLGANTLWKRVTFTRGFGARAAKRARFPGAQNAGYPRQICSQAFRVAAGAELAVRRR